MNYNFAHFVAVVVGAVVANIAAVVRCAVRIDFVFFWKNKTDWLLMRGFFCVNNYVNQIMVTYMDFFCPITNFTMCSVFGDATGKTYGIPNLYSTWKQIQAQIHFHDTCLFHWQSEKPLTLSTSGIEYSNATTFGKPKNRAGIFLPSNSL